MRCNLRDIIYIFENFYSLWELNRFSNLKLDQVYSNCESYLAEYLSKSKNDITGSQFASLIEHIAYSQSNNIH